MLCLLPIDSKRSGALACALRDSRLCLGGRSWYGAPRSCENGERHLAGAAPLCRAQTDYYQCGMARARRKRACCASSRETASAVARSRALHAKAGCASEVAAGTSQHGLGPMKRDFSPVRWPYVGYTPTIISAAWRARVASARAAPRLERHRAQWRTRVSATRKPAVCSRSQLARHSTVLRRR